MYAGKISYVCSGRGSLTVVTGFPVTRARVSFATLPISAGFDEYSTSSSSTEIMSSSSSFSDTSSSESESLSSDSLLSDSSSESTSSSSVTSSSSSFTEIPTDNLPSIYVSGYTNTGFIVTYVNIPANVGYIEFEYSAV
jgi:hypothetical protein